MSSMSLEQLLVMLSEAFPTWRFSAKNSSFKTDQFRFNVHYEVIARAKNDVFTFYADLLDEWGFCEHSLRFTEKKSQVIGLIDIEYVIRATEIPLFLEKVQYRGPMVDLINRGVAAV